MNKDKKAILIGMVLGDGSIKKQEYVQANGEIKTYGVFSVTHGIKQEDYLKHKAKLLGRCLKQIEPKVGYYTADTAFGTIESCKISKQHPYFRVLRGWMYPNNKKYISSFILNKLNEHAIALWYMDDGGLSKKKNKHKWSVEMRISTYFSEEEANVFIQYFKEKWDISAKKRFSKKTETYYMAFNGTESLKLELLIGKYIIPSMSYKLPSYWNPRVLDNTNCVEDIV